MNRFKLPIVICLLLGFATGCVTSRSDYFTDYHATLPKELEKKSITYTIRRTHNSSIAKKFNAHTGAIRDSILIDEKFREVFSPATTHTLTPAATSLKTDSDISLDIHVQVAQNPLSTLPLLLCSCSGTLFPCWVEFRIYLKAIATDNKTGRRREYLIERRYTSAAQLFFFILAGWSCESESDVTKQIHLANFQQLRHWMEEDGFFNSTKPESVNRRTENKPQKAAKAFTPVSHTTGVNTQITPKYRVIFDNFDNETGLGEYAVVFENSATFADTRAVRSEVFAYAKELFCEIRPNVSLDDIDIVSWKGRFDSTKGENYYTFTMSLAAVTPFNIAYDNQSRRGQIKVQIEGEDVASTITWAKRNIASLVERYNRVLSGSDDIPESGTYIFEREETTDDGYYIFHFKVIN